MGWNKIKEQVHYNFDSVATKQHVASMLIDQQHKLSETLQEYVKQISDLLLQSSGFLLHQAEDLAHITHFICNLHNQKLLHYVLGKNPTSVQNAITLVQKKDAELCIIDGLHNHDPGHKVNNNYSKQNENQNNMGPCHGCNGLHLIQDCESSICKSCKPQLGSHTPARCPRKRPLSIQQKKNKSSHTNNNTRNQSNGNNYPNLQLSLSTCKLDHIAGLLEATKKMFRYFKKLYKHNKSHHTSTDSHHLSTNHNSSTHSDKCKCKSCKTNDQANEIVGQTHAT